MKALLITAALLCPVSPRAAEDWWNKDWKFRRPITINNRLERPLGKGYTLQVEVDPDYLGIREKSKPGLDDWALVRGAERVPFLLQPGKGKTLLICFRAAADIRAGASDTYQLYYGAPEATAVPVAHDQVYEFWEDFSRPEALAARFQVDPDLTVAVQDGALVIREVANGRTASMPAKLVFRNFPQLEGFELSFDLEMDSSDAAAAGFAVTLELKEPGANDPSIGKKAEELIEKLGDDSWELREKATREMITLGRPAVAKLQEALRSADAEVKWRAGHILREIGERSPAPLVSAGVVGGDPKMPVKLASVIGKNKSGLNHKTGWPVKTTIVLQRDPEGDVKILWNGRFPQSGQMPGPIQQVAFSIFKGTPNALGTIKIDNILVRRFVEEDSRPTSMIDVEERKP
jgi:hypothetical protein